MSVKDVGEKMQVYKKLSTTYFFRPHILPTTAEVFPTFTNGKVCQICVGLWELSYWLVCIAAKELKS